MEHTNDGLTLWYDTPDAPLAGGTVTVGARPPHPSNAVALEYRVDGGPVRRAPACALGGPTGQGAQYFRAQLPVAGEGAQVECLPVLTCGGRQVPSAGQVARGQWLSYRQAAPPPVPPAAVPPSAVVRPQFTSDLEFLASVSVNLAAPESIGVVPQGLRLNFDIESGSCVGPRLTAKIYRSGEDSMLVQRDGLAIPNVRTTWETPEGALLFGEYSGTFDLGPDGYDKALHDQFPTLPVVRLTPRFVTSHPSYQWLTRLQCVGIGQVDMEKLFVQFDLHAVRGGQTLPARGGRSP